MDPQRGGKLATGKTCGRKNMQALQTQNRVRLYLISDLRSMLALFVRFGE